MFGPQNSENDVKDYLAHGMDPNYCLKMYDGWQYREKVERLMNGATLDGSCEIKTVPLPAPNS